MGTIKLEDIIGYGVGEGAKKNVCVFCVTVEERNKSNELNYILESEIERKIFCDRCGKEMIFSEVPDVDP